MVFFALRKQLTLKSNTCGGVKKKSLNNAPSDLKPTAYLQKIRQIMLQDILVIALFVEAKVILH